MFDDNMSVGSLAVPPEADASSVLDEATVKGGRELEDHVDSPYALAARHTRPVRIGKGLVVIVLCVATLYIPLSIHFSVVSLVEECLGDDNTEDCLDEVKNNAGTISIASACILGSLLLLFFIYDSLVSKRHFSLLNLADRSKNIVDQLFPSTVRKRLLNTELTVKRRSSRTSGTNHSNEEEPVREVSLEKLTRMNTQANKHIDNFRPIPISPAAQPNSNTPETKRFQSDAIVLTKNQPIADLFQNATVFFADIAGFTAWSAEREPHLVFTLLESVYAAFDELATKLNVFKVETIGDSYMAVTGLPEPDDAHAVTMARFAYQCLVKMQNMTADLDEVLGPGTKDLTVRIGIHSGPVTAGVLRGQKFRFQLFGDTVNTASRMESTGEKGRIQLSQDTADLLIAAGKGHWIRQRDETVVAKGKGEMVTFWLEPTGKNTSSQERSRQMLCVEDLTNDEGSDDGGSVARSVHTADLPAKQAKWPDSPLRQVTVKRLPSKMGLVTVSTRDLRDVTAEQRAQDEELVKHNTEILMKRLLEVMSRRRSSGRRFAKEVDHSFETSEMAPPLEMVSDSISFPAYDPEEAEASNEYLDTTTMFEVYQDLFNFVSEIASLYNDIPFHNFEHASHTTLAMNKLLCRITGSSNISNARSLHIRTCGISSDPLTHFALVFATLIHDVGHTGVTNAQLVKEEARVAIKFRNKSVGEQNSLALAWSLLLEPRFERLRSCIYQTKVEKKRFRQVLINAVMATDIGDRELVEQREDKWVRAFHNSNVYSLELTKVETDRRASAIIEVMMQVADIAHTMQHYNIYRRWNEKLFEEMNWAYTNNRCGTDPLKIWYQGELNFFDHYVIPLARKMEECGAFGPSGGQYLTYAISNRNEWQSTGAGVLADMKDALSCKEDPGSAMVELADGDSDSDTLSIMNGTGQPMNQNWGDNSSSDLTRLSRVLFSLE